MKPINILFIVTLIILACLSCGDSDEPPTLTDLTVYVYDSESGDSICGALLTMRAISRPGRIINPNSSDASGKYVFRTLESGYYTLQAEKTGYIPNEMPVDILPNKSNEATIPMTKIHN